MKSLYLALFLVGLGAGASAQDWMASKYGPDDEIGAANLTTPERVKTVAGLVTEGGDEFPFVLGQVEIGGAVQMIINPVAIR